MIVLFINENYQEIKTENDEVNEEIAFEKMSIVDDNVIINLPEKDNPYPLCIGRGRTECEECQLHVEWEPNYHMQPEYN